MLVSRKRLRISTRPVVVHHDVDRYTLFFRNLLVQFIYELQKLLVAVLVMATPGDFPGQHIQGCKQGSRTVPDVIMGLPLRYARA